MSLVWPHGETAAGPGWIRAGFYHLKSSDPTLPEISLVLSNGPMAELVVRLRTLRRSILLRRSAHHHRPGPHRRDPPIPGEGEMTQTFPLQLRWTSSPVRRAEAWLIAGNEAVQWIEEIATWKVPMSDLKLLVLPSSMEDRKVSGVLVIPPREIADKIAPTPRAWAYGAIASRLFIPVDSQLEPEASATELSELLLHEFQILHPSMGLVGFSASDVLSIADMIAPPHASEMKWDRATAGVATAPRLLSIESDVPPTLQTFLKSATPSSMGSMAPPKEQPPAKPASTLKDALRIESPDASPHGLDGRTPPPRFPCRRDGSTRWAIGHQPGFQRRMKKFNDARFAELNRLMAMMEANPDGIAICNSAGPDTHARNCPAIESAFAASCGF